MWALVYNVAQLLAFFSAVRRRSKLSRSDNQCPKERAPRGRLLHFCELWQ